MKRVKRTLLYAFLSVMTVIWLLPVFSSLVTAFRTMSDLQLHGFWSVPRVLTAANFAKAWTQSRLKRYVANSFVITMPALFFMMFLSSLGAYALARFRFPGNKALYFMFVGGMLLPFQVLMLPVFRLTNQLGLYDTRWALVVFHTAFQLGFCTFVLRNFMLTVPQEILDAARVDGASEIRIYRQIMLPLTMPALAAVATLEFTWVFNDYLWAIVLLRRDSLKPVTAGLATLLGQYTTDWPLIVAGSLIATTPTIVVFVFLQRYFIQGLTMGATKG